MPEIIVSGLPVVCGALLGATVVRLWFGRARWVVRINNRVGTETPPMTYFAARALSQKWPKSIARVVRIGDGW